MRAHNIYMTDIKNKTLGIRADCRLYVQPKGQTKEQTGPGTLSVLERLNDKIFHISTFQPPV